MPLPQKISELLREAGMIALFAALVYLGVALLTYAPEDLDAVQVANSGEVFNLGGRVGALLANLLFNLFGWSAYLLLLLACAAVWRLRRRAAILGEIGAWDGTLVPAAIFAAMLGLCGLEQIYYTDMSATIRAGGILGYSAAPFLAENFGVVGASVMLLALIVGGLTLALHVSWLKLMDRIGYAAITAGAGAGAYLEKRIEKMMDRGEGARERRRRRASVKQLREELNEMPAPKIHRGAPPSSHAPESSRRRAERQSNLFPQAPQPGELPPLSLLEAPNEQPTGYSREALESMSQLLVKKLKDFNVDITVTAVQPGPVITRFEIDPAPGVKASQIVALSRDLARSLSVESVRVVDNIAGKSVIGIEIPNQSRELVRLVEGLSSPEYEESASPLTLVLGKDIAGNAVITDLQRMPHVLIAGTTGSGKSVCVNALILSALYKATPQQVRLIMVDPKFLELSVYDGIPHLLAPVVTDMTKAANALRWCIAEMDRRFRVMAAIGVRNIAGYNKKVAAAIAEGAPLLDPFARRGEEESSAENAGTEESSAEISAKNAENDGILQEIPYIMVVVDELADLMMVVGKKIEEIIIRIAQRARAAGIHMVLATQRPSVDVVTGLIKANVPTRIAFQVSSRADSRTVLDQMGAEQLLGEGDMLFLPPGTGHLQRVHGSFVSDEEVLRVVGRLKESGTPVYLEQVTENAGPGEFGGGLDGEEIGGDGEADELYDQAVQFVTQSRRASISSLQRALRVGYNRAARMIESMEESGVVSASENGKREVLAPAPPKE